MKFRFFQMLAGDEAVMGLGAGLLRSTILPGSLAPEWQACKREYPAPVWSI